jgi:hypothetical protein
MRHHWDAMSLGSEQKFFSHMLVDVLRALLMDLRCAIHNRLSVSFDRWIGVDPLPD